MSTRVWSLGLLLLGLFTAVTPADEPGPASAANAQVAVEVRLLTVSERNFELLCAGAGGPGEAPRDFDPARVTFLSDAQVRQFLGTVQGDERTSVLQAPKLTVGSGEASTLRVQEKHYFVTGYKTEQVGDQKVKRPRNEMIPTGLELTVRPTVAADRRSVQVALNMNLTELASANVPLFPVTTMVTPVYANGAEGKPVPFTQFLQQPVFTTLSLEKTLSIPDGGTAVLGGWKRRCEGRNEFGPPVLNRIPYVNRLFKTTPCNFNEMEHVLLLVTPRVILLDEAHLTATPPQTTGRAAEVLSAYHRACTEGRHAEAKQLALRALELDPTCFHPEPPAGANR